MKNMLLSVLSSCAVCGLPSTVFADGEASTAKPLAGFHASAGFSTSLNQSMSANYRDTECLDIFNVMTEQRLGFVCSSSDQEFVREMGIERYDALDAGARPPKRPKCGLIISTPMKRYGMKEFLKGQPVVNSAVVDCDTSGDVIYRATASCHVGFARDARGNAIYSNLVVADHVNNKATNASTASIQQLWRRLSGR